MCLVCAFFVRITFELVSDPLIKRFAWNP